MPHVNIDSILSRLTDWDLKLTIAGKTFSVAPPTIATLGLIQKISDGGTHIADVKATLVDAIAPLIDKSAGVNPSEWDISQLLAAATALFQHAKETAGKNLAGVAHAVRTAMAPAPKAAQTQTAAPLAAPLAAMAGATTK